MGSKEKESDRGAAVFGIGVVALAVGTPLFFALGWPRVHGATPMQIMDEPLSRTPKQLAKDLPASSSDKTSATVKFRKGAAGEYERVDFTWASARSDAPDEMRLRTDYHAHAGPEATAALRRHFHALDDGRHRWGPVTIRARDDGDLSFNVDPIVNGQPNPLFDRQIEAAKQVILNAAFDLPIRVSDKEIADVLGSGYAPSVLARFDATTPIENAVAALRALMPATLASGSSSFYVPLDHPLVTKVYLSWRNRAGGRLSSMSLTTSKAYPSSRATLEACLEKQLGPPRIEVTDYAAGQKDYTFALGAISLDLASNSMGARVLGDVNDDSFAKLFHALDACKDAAETGGATK